MRILGTGAAPEKGCAVTIGAFDGVHLGHRALIDRVRSRADALGCAAAVVTFDRHPASIVRPQSAPKLLTDLDQKLELLAATGIDYTLVIPFDAARAAEPADDFVREVLLGRLRARCVVIGHDFHFGKGRAGNAALLQSMGREFGFEVEELAPIADQSEVISSTLIRSLLDRAEVTKAAELLGRPHEVRGLVVMGDGRGRDLGCPTANVQVSEDILIPENGVYGGQYVFPDGSSKPAAISVGTRPTFYEDGTRLVEAHVVDFEGDLYGQHAGVRFDFHIRGQERFDSMDALIAQMATDVEAVRHPA